MGEYKEAFDILWAFVTEWAYMPASTVIILIVMAQKKFGIVDLGKMRWITAMFWAMLFAFAQKYMAEPLGYEPIQTEWIKVIMMGLMTGLSAILTHTIGKNSKQLANKLLKKEK